MSNIVRYSDTFLRSAEPTEEEIWAFNSTVQAMDDQFALMAETMPDSIKMVTQQQGKIIFLTADMPRITLDLDNWWKHILRERIQNDVVAEFGEKAANCNVTAVDFSQIEGALLVDLECMQKPVTLGYQAQDGDRIDTYSAIREREGFKALKSIITRIGGIDLTVLLNANQAGVETEANAEFPNIPTVILATRDQTPLIDKVSRFEEFGPVH